MSIRSPHSVCNPRSSTLSRGLRGTRLAIRGVWGYVALAMLSAALTLAFVSTRSSLAPAAGVASDEAGMAQGNAGGGEQSRN